MILKKAITGIIGKTSIKAENIFLEESFGDIHQITLVSRF
jgi:hypothetical protein